MKQLPVFCLWVFSGLLFAAGPAFLSPAVPNPLSPLTPLDREGSLWVSRTLGSMTLEEKVGQLIIGGTSTGYTNVTTASFQRISAEIRDYHLGGYHAFRGQALSAAFLIRRMQQAASIPLLITADLEGGAGLIFEGATRFPKAMALAATRDPRLAFLAGRTTALEARQLGIGVNFYPVVDVNNNPENPIINIRSFGEDPALVAEFSSAYIAGVQQNGVLATVKHFPGHGDTATDSHLELPVITAGRKRLEEVELPPFRASIEAGVAAVMTAHLSIPALEPELNLPATFSPRILEGLLRRDFGFKGLVFTDAMNMYAISKRYPDGEAAVKAFQAGADLILYPLSVQAAHAALLEAVENGSIKSVRLDASVQRILEAKARLGLYRAAAPDLLETDRLVGSASAAETSRQIMEKAVTLVRDQRNALPFKPEARSRILVILMPDSNSTSTSWGSTLVQTARSRFPETIQTRVLPEATSTEAGLVLELARLSDYVVVAAGIRVAAFKGSIQLSESQMSLLRRLAGLEKPSAFVVFGSPYLLAALPELPSYILTYDDYADAEEVAIRAILGEIPFQGRLPISLPGLYPGGHGLIR